MWLRDLIQLRSALTDHSSLLRENNSLLRELILAVSHRHPVTPPSSPASTSTRQRPSSLRVYSGDDVFTVTRERRMELDQLEKDKIQAPWRHPMETLAAIEQQQQETLTASRLDASAPVAASPTK